MALFGRRKGDDGPKLGADGVPDPQAWAPRWAATVNPSLEANERGIRQRVLEGGDANTPSYAAGYPQYVERRASATLV